MDYAAWSRKEVLRKLHLCYGVCLLTNDLRCGTVIEIFAQPLLLASATQRSR